MAAGSRAKKGRSAKKKQTKAPGKNKQAAARRNRMR